MFTTRNIRLLLEYDGTNYGGWQRQNNAVTIQEILEASISAITRESVELTGCSRTDAGVHARGFVCNFLSNSSIPIEKYRDAINTKLPRNIVVLNSEEADLDFHARHSCTGKTYSYTILNRQVPCAIERNYVYYYKAKIDFDSMVKAAEFLVGTHDFSSFKNTGSSVKTAVRTITELQLSKQEEMIKIYASADGFLYNMVRIIVGTLLQVGIGRISPWDVREILLSKDRTKAGPSVPPQGLCLEKVYY